jgi:acetyltransferase-like isoleucine patch superfamily enzyme
MHAPMRDETQPPTMQTVNGLPDNPYNAHCWITGTPQIGEDVWIGAFTLIDGMGGLTIGRGVNISCGVSILTHSTVKRCVTERVWNQIDYQPTVIEDYVFIGQNATVLMGCTIGHHSIIGAGALLAENTIIPPYSMVVGVPARVVKNIESTIEDWKQEWQKQQDASV